MPRELTEQERRDYDRGQAAEDLINDPVFILAMNELSNQYISDLLATRSYENDKRDGFYHLTKATQGVVETLKSWVYLKDQLNATLNNEDYED